MPKFFHDRFSTPLGLCDLVCDEEGRLRLFGWYAQDTWRRPFAADEIVVRADPFGLRGAFEAYFSGDAGRLDALPVVFAGSAFQNRVWQALRAIPAGETQSYGDIAKRIDAPKAVRAVGLANGANPIALAVPCHRVIGSNGSLTGYGGGLGRKKWLLAHEARYAGTGLFNVRTPG